MHSLREKGIMQKGNIISLSGGKDSTALLLLMLERNEPIHSVVTYDTGWEFPEIIEHIDKLETYTGLKFVRLHPAKSFDHLMSSKPVYRNRIGENRGEFRHYGYGWPSACMRWCTGEKRKAIELGDYSTAFVLAIFEGVFKEKTMIL